MTKLKNPAVQNNNNVNVCEVLQSLLLVAYDYYAVTLDIPIYFIPEHFQLASVCMYITEIERFYKLYSRFSCFVASYLPFHSVEWYENVGYNCEGPDMKRVTKK